MKNFIFVTTITFLYSLNILAQNKQMDSIMNLWISAIDVQNYDLAVEHGEHLLQFYGNNFSTQDLMYFSIRNKVIFMYLLNGQVQESADKAIDNYREIQSVLGEDNEIYVEALKILAHTLRETGNLRAMDSIFHKQSAIYPKGSPNYPMYINDLGQLYRLQGKYAKSEEYLLESIKLYEEYEGETQNYGIVHNNLGLLYFELGLYTRAEEYYKKALTIFEALSNYDIKHYRIIKSNLASVYITQHKYYEAEQIFNETITTADNNSVDYMSANYSLAFLYNQMGEIKKAQQKYSECLTLSQKYIGTDNEIYRASINGLASIYQIQGNYAKAKKLLTDNLNYLNKKYDKTHHLYTTTLGNLGTLHYVNKKPNKAYQYFTQYSHHNKQSIIDNFVVLSENEKNTHLELTKDGFDTFQNLALDYSNVMPKISGEVFDNILFHKKLVLFNTQAFQQLVNNSHNPELLNLYNRLYDIRQQIARMRLLPKFDDVKKIESAQKEAQNIESELVFLARQYADSQNIQFNYQHTSYTDFKNILQKDEALIEFTSFQRYHNNRWQDSIYYCAFVMRKNYKYPKMVFITNEQALTNILNRQPHETTEAAYIKRLYNKQTDTVNELYNLTWRNIEPLLDGITKIYISPAGLMHTIQFHALPIDRNRYLKDKYELLYFTSSKDIINSSPLYFNQIQTASLFGDVTYNADSVALTNLIKNNNISKQSVRATSLHNNKRIVLDPLPDTKIEVEKLQKLLDNNGTQTWLYSDLNANENSFKMLEPQNCNLLHISTHGFFFANEQTQQFNILSIQSESSNFDNALLRSGLYLAGAQQSLDGKQYLTDVEDGILTSYEIGLQNFEHTKLLVLSACQTGLGDIKGDEGLVGLNRAFKIAGVEYMILALWQIPSYQTQEIMELFYNYFVAGKNITVAFETAQEDMRQKYNNPYFWAGLKLIH